MTQAEKMACDRVLENIKYFKGEKRRQQESLRKSSEAGQPEVKKPGHHGAKGKKVSRLRK